MPETFQQRTGENYRAWHVFREFVDSFDGTQVSDFHETVKWAKRAAVLAPTSHNSQPFGFAKGIGATVDIIPDLSRRLVASDPDDRELYLSLGAVAANFKITAHALGWNTGESFSGEGEAGSVIQTVHLQAGRTRNSPDILLFEQIPFRRNYDGEHLLDPIDSQTRQILTDTLLYGGSEVGFALIEDQIRKNQIGNLVEEGDRAIFADPKFSSELVRWMRSASTSRKDGLLVSVMGIPLELQDKIFGVIVDRREEFIDMAAKGDRTKIRSSAGIGVLSLAHESPESWMKLGELYETAALRAQALGYSFGARAVLIETGDLHQDLELVANLDGRAQMMFRIGKSAQEFPRAPRFSAEEKTGIYVEGKKVLIDSEKPNFFKISTEQEIERIFRELDNPQILDGAYLTQWLPSLFEVRNPNLKKGTQAYHEKLEHFVKERSESKHGTWVYFAPDKQLVRFPDEEEVYEILTANNSRIISYEAQEKFKTIKVGVCGLSGSGGECALSAVMSGVRNLRIGDFDPVSPRNKNRMEGPIGENKTWVFAWRAWRQNPYVKLETFNEGVTAGNIETFVDGLDLIVEQTDSESKFTVREIAKCPVVMITNFQDPVVRIDMPGDEPFGGNARRANITKERMRGIGSIGESTAYLLPMMNVDKVPPEVLENFTDIVEGRSDAYSQTFMSAQSTGGIFGRLLVAFAEGKLESLPKSFQISTLPRDDDYEERQKAARERFLQTYSTYYQLNFGDVFAENQ